MVPRLWMTFLSLLNDVIVFKLGNKLFCNANLAIVGAILYANSYTSWLYCTRTFSNCFETILYGLLLYMVSSYCDQITGASTISGKKCHLFNRIEKISCLISTIVISGFFTRISFVIFMIVPLLFWLGRGVTVTKNNGKKAFSIIVMKIVALIPGSVCTTIFFVLCDSWYFSYGALLDLPSLLHLQNVTMLSAWVENLPLSPLNSLKYNAHVSNLAKHGLHPWYLHATVNMPLMFTPLVYILIPALSQVNVYLQNCGKNYSKPLVHMLRNSILFSLGCLSLISHQEPRFLLPLIVPISVLMSKCFYSFASRKILLMAWISFNFFYFIFFALLHQGGVIPSMNFVGALSKAHVQKNSTVEVIYYKTYLPPMHLAAISHNSSSIPSKLKVRDLAGSPYDVLEETLDAAFFETSDVYVAFPASLPCSHINELQKKYLLEECYSVFPHLSMEDPPWSTKVCQYNNERNWKFLLNVINKMTLSFYKVTSANSSAVPGAVNS